MSSIPIVQSEPHLSSRDQWQCNSSQPWQPTRPAALILQWRFWLPVYRQISKSSDSALKAVTWFKGVRVRGGSQRWCSNESQWLPNVIAEFDLNSRVWEGLCFWVSWSQTNRWRWVETQKSTSHISFQVWLCKHGAKGRKYELPMARMED